MRAARMSQDPGVAVAAHRPLTHLEVLESEAIHVMREVAAELERPVLLFSGCLLYTSPSPRDRS